MKGQMNNRSDINIVKVVEEVLENKRFENTLIHYFFWLLVLSDLSMSVKLEYTDDKNMVL